MRGGEIDESGSRRDAELAPDARPVPFGRSHRDVQVFRYFPVGVAARE